MKKLVSLLAGMAILLSTGGGALAKDIQVKGYTKKDGTKVAGYTKHVADKDEKKDEKKDDKKAEAKADKATTTETVKTVTESKDSKGTDTVEVKGYTKKDGTKVAGYTRKKSNKSK
jgi:hypothetical protein